MAKNSVDDYSVTAASNSDIDGLDSTGATGLVKSGDNYTRSLMSHLKAKANDDGAVNTVGGTGDAITVTLASNPTALVDGMRFSINAPGTNTGAVTIAVSNSGATLLGTKKVRKWSGGAETALSAGDITSGHILNLVYDSARDTAAGAFMIDGGASVAAATTSAAGIVQKATLPQTLAGAPAGLVPTVENLYFPTGHLYGLTLSNNGSDATNDIDIAAGTARDGSDTYNMILASALTKRLDAAWAVGTGNGGLDTGSIANTTYHVWLIKRSDTGVVDALFSTSASSPTMPSNYDYKRRIGSIIRVSAAIRTFVQDGDLFSLVTSTEDISAANPGTSAVTATLASIPTGIRVRAKVVGKVSYTTTSALPIFGSISDLSTTDQAPGATTNANVTLLTSTASGNTQPSEVEIMTNTSAQVRYRVSFSDANLTFRINTLGWFDPRGRQ